MKKKANPKIILDLTESDLSDLMNGKVFHWTYPAQNGQEIDVELYNEDIERRLENET